MAGDDLGRREIGEEAGERQGQRGQHLPAGDRDQPPIEGDQSVERGAEVGVTGADRDEVVRVVADRGGERAAPQAEAAHQADADVAGCAVPLDDDQLEEVARGVGDRLAVADGRALDQAARDDLAGDRLDHRQRAAGVG